MVSLISVGIEKYENNRQNGLNDIPCAYSDAKKIYEVFEKILGQEMKKCSSASLKDISALECRALLSAMQLSVEKEDIFVFYFSGHGVIGSNGKLKLVFTDCCYSDEKGTMMISEIVSILSGYHCKVVLILDCCYSGAGLVESNSDDVKLENSVSILASNRPISRAKYGRGGSEFTIYLCKALEKLYDLGKDITLDGIYEEIQKEYKNCQIVTGGGSADVIFKKYGKAGLPEGFVEKFVSKIDSSNYEMREALWYGLGNFPEPLRMEVLARYEDKNDKSIAEMSWRVRRAIGSICRLNVTERGNGQIRKLLASSNWMDRCVGYISVHKKSGDDITQRMKKELEDKNNPMDLVWLIVLYLSERDWPDKKIVLKTNLVKSVWGSIEIWKRYFGEVPLEDRMELFKMHMDDESYKKFCLELYYRGEWGKINFSDYPEEVQIFHDNITELYSGKARGSIEESQNNKWIFSILYGNWRDQIDLSTILEKRLKSLRKNEKKKFLQSLRYVPSVEIKMAVLDFFTTKFQEDRYRKLKNELQWALEDEHPWVIRTALPLFADEQELVEKKISKNISMEIYPGVFDLAIELRKQGIDQFQYEIENMTDIEETQLKRAMDNE